jgi:hypothetical protein
MILRNLLLMTAAFSCSCSAAPEQPIEVGKVQWQRDLGTALASSKESKKPVFALFQEVPGCEGCQQFGKDVLSNPLIVDAIENSFVPLLIHNNAGGKDAEVLKRFNEPAWNYQVVRFLDAKGNDLIPRKDKVWTTGPLAYRMIQSLDKAKRPIPRYLSILEAEQSPDLRTVAFSMHCFWTGEMKIGQIEGIVTTEAGFLDGNEVTLVKYDPRAITLRDLIAAASSVDCANGIYLTAEDMKSAPDTHLRIAELTNYRPAPDSDQKKQLSGTNHAKLGLTPGQATKFNAWLLSKPDLAAKYLSPPQRAAFKR